MVGKLIAVEGIDGVGKTTQARRLAKSRGYEYTFQFGATDVGAVIRDLLLDPSHDKLDNKTEALLVIADKAQHVAEIVRPALTAGKNVVTDRYTASTLAYQGYGRGIPLEFLEDMLGFATGGLVPDLTVLLDIDPDCVKDRWRPKIDRLESAVAEASFVKRIREGYRKLAGRFPSRWVVVDAVGSIDEVAAKVDEAVNRHFGV